MVEYTSHINALDAVFASLADPTRRDILDRLKSGALTVSEIALPYDMSLAAISKHLKIMEAARMINKKRDGRHQIVTLSPAALQSADEYLRQYETIWNQRFDALEDYLQNNQSDNSHD